ncbi:MAG: helix-turn-helix domain-containing protein [Candidatus Bathyarchaeota archaeon]|nr:helix-turn-helix domain-containing protein [Candidatus Bathyarchaeota archaeon]
MGVSQLKVADIRVSSRGTVKHLVELDAKDAKKIVENSKSTLAGDKTECKSSLWFESEGCDVCSTILAHGAFLLSGKSIEEQMVMYSFIVPSFEDYTSIISDLEEAGYKVNVLRRGSFEAKNGVLTKKQEKIFWLALQSGFFDYPRKIGLSELAAKLGVRPATLSEIIRRGTKRLLKQYFEKEIVK